MKLKRVVAMPFAVVADLATLGNMGGRSFTQQLFDAERRERSMEHERELVRLAVDMQRAEGKGESHGS